MRYGQCDSFCSLNPSFPASSRVCFHGKVSIDERKKSRNFVIFLQFVFEPCIRLWGEWLCKFSVCEKFILRPTVLEIVKWTEISISIWIAGIWSCFSSSSSTSLTLGWAKAISEQLFFWNILDHGAWLGAMNLTPTRSLPGARILPQGVHHLGRETQLQYDTMRVGRGMQGMLWWPRKESPNPFWGEAREVSQ